MGNILLLTVCPFSRFLFSMHLQVLTTSDTGAERPLFPYGTRPTDYLQRGSFG